MLDLSLMFDYDLWATRRWLLALPSFQNLGRAHEILEHMLFAQRVWLERVDIELPKLPGNIPMNAVFEQLHGAWKYVVEEGQLDTEIEYTNSKGEGFRNTIREIACHVLNHGTYHRGQLRGLAEADGFEGFPDTDLILYLRS